MDFDRIPRTTLAERKSEPQRIGWDGARKKVDVDNDTFFTPPELAQTLYEEFLSVMQSKGIDIDEYLFIEPSAGNGVFSDLMPPDRIAIDIEPKAPSVEQADFLDYQPPDDPRRVIAVGNPPFGVRAHYALAFMDRLFRYFKADYVAFLLPPCFSEETTTITHGIRKMGIAPIYENKFRKLKFINPNGNDRYVNGVVFQVWERNSNNIFVTDTEPSVDTYITIKHFGTKNQNEEIFKDAALFVEDFISKKGGSSILTYDEVKPQATAIFVHKDHERVIKCLKEADFENPRYHYLNSLGFKQLRFRHIKRILLDNGIQD